MVAAEPCDNSNEKWCATCLFCIVQPYRSTDKLDCIRSNKNVWWLCGESAEGCPTDSKIWCGLGYTGPLCSNCDDGFGRGGIDRENNCERCGSLVRQFGSFFMFVAACLLAWMLHFLIGWFAVTKNDLALTHARLGIALVIVNADYGTNLWPRIVGPARTPPGERRAYQRVTPVDAHCRRNHSPPWSSSLPLAPRTCHKQPGMFKNLLVLLAVSIELCPAQSQATCDYRNQALCAAVAHKYGYTYISAGS